MAGKFAKAVVDMQPLLSMRSEGNPDPNQRLASVTLEFVGEDAIKQAHILMDILHDEIEEV